jgi:membrane-associated phospholipid phosphatase
LAVPYVASRASLTLAGVEIVVPWMFLAWIGLVAIPAAYSLTRLLDVVASYCPRPAWLMPLLGAALGLLAVWGFPRLAQAPLAVLMVFLALVVRDAPRASRASLITLAGSIGVVVVGYAAVWNLNYALAPTRTAGLHDPVLRAADIAVYGWLLPAASDYRALFPLVQHPPAFALLEHAYQMLFAELFVVLFVLVRCGQHPATFLRAVFLCYLLGLLVFFYWPAVGPCIAYPESFDPGFHGTATWRLMQSMAIEFAALGQGTALNGFAYFVAVPSLHVAMAILLQYFLRVSPWHFWAFLPVNVLMAASTVLLGYHYLLDAPAGALAAVVALWVVRPTPRAPGSCTPSRDRSRAPTPPSPPRPAGRLPAHVGGS